MNPPYGSQECFWALACLSPSDTTQDSANEALGGLDGGDQRSDAQDVHDALEIIRQHMQGHLGADPFESLHLKVGRAHSRLDRAGRMLDGLSPPAQHLRVFVETAFDGLDEMLVFPSRDPALGARGTAVLDGAVPAGAGPVAPQGQPLPHSGVVIDHAFSGRTDVDIVFRQVPEVIRRRPTGPYRLCLRTGQSGLTKGDLS